MQLLTAGKQQMYALAFAPDGQALVAAGQMGLPRLWTLPAVGDPVPLCEQVPGTCYAFTFTPDSNLIGWLTDQKRVEYDRRTGSTCEVQPFDVGERVFTQTMCGPNGALVASTGLVGGGPRLRAFSPDAQGDWAEAWAVERDSPAWRIAGSRTDRFFAWESSRHDTVWRTLLVVRSLATGEILEQTAAPTHYALGLVASPDGSALLMFKDSSLYFWKVGEKIVKVRTGTLKHYRSVAFHPDGRHLLAGNNDTTARLIDTHTWEVVRQYTWDVGELSAVAVSPDAILAAAGGRKGRVVVWDLDL